MASQNTLPGDFLYGWKVGFVETVESTFVVGAQSRADFEVARTTKRLQEITELSASKNADSSVVSKAQKRLQDQITVASETIAKAAEKDSEKALETAVKLGAVLNAHQNVLTTIEKSADSETKTQMKNTISTIENTTSDIKNTIESLKEQNKLSWILTKTDAELKVEAELKFKTSQDALDNVWQLVIILDEDSDIRLKAEQNLGAAQEEINNAETLMGSNIYNEALDEIQNAAQLISETDELLKATQESGEVVREIFVSPAPTDILTPALDLVIPTKSLDSLQDAL